MKRILTLALFGLLAACQTPGYDYAGRVAPSFTEALNYTDVVAGRFEGPAGQTAEREFGMLIQTTQLDGRPWFIVADPDRPQGVYEGGVRVSSYRGEVRYELERRCIEYDGPFDCETRGFVERECVKEIVDVSVSATLVDLNTQRRVFTSEHGGATEREDCRDIIEFRDNGQSEGPTRDIIYETYNSYDAPYGMIETAVISAVGQFRTDIAPYTASFRAEIVTKPLVGEEAGDARFAAAVKATKQGNFLGACAQWQELAAAYPTAPGIQHNWGACAEARGDLASAHSQYARAADLARQIVLLKDKDAKPIFDALERVSRGRYEENLIDQAAGNTGS